MSKQVYTISKEGLDYLCGLIRDIVSTPSELISDITLATNQTMSSVKIDKIIKQCLQDANEYSNEVVNSLTHLIAEKIDFEPTLDNTTNKINTLLLYSANNDNNYTQYLRLTNELLNLGDTSLSFNEYVKVVDADAKYTLKTTTDTLTTEVTNIKSDFTTHKDDTDIHTSVDEKAKWNDTADKVNGEDLVKKADIKTTTLDENATDDEIYGGKAIYDAIKANAIGKETVLYDGNITATGTYTLNDDVNNYDFIVINHRYKDGTCIQSVVMSKLEISKCIDASNIFQCNYGRGNASYCVEGYLNNDKIIITIYQDENITSITGYKFGQITIQNTITNPSTGKSYSLDEQLTGGTWIDGKPIYRKGGFVESIPSGTSPVLDSTLTLSLVNVIVQTGGSATYTAGNLLSIGGYSGASYRGSLIITKNGLAFLSSSDSYKNVYWWIEYTKKTD